MSDYRIEDEPPSLFHFSVPMFSRRVASFARNRYFSSGVEPKPAGGGTDAKPSAAWSKSKKYGILGVPLLLTAVVVTDLVCNVRHRAALEEYCPTFVRLVREHYGFDDEDELEIARVKGVSSLHSKAVKVVVGNPRGQNGRIELTVDGTVLLDDLIQQVYDQQKQAGAQSDNTPMELLASLNFDEVVQASVEDTSAPVETGSTTESAASSDLSVQLFDETYTPQHSTVWSGPARPQTLREGLRAVVDSNNNDNVKFGDVVMNRSVNPSYDFLEGLNAYARFGTQLSLGDISRRADRAVPVRRKPVQNQAAVQADLAKIHARQRVNDLQQYIKRLEFEMQAGARDIDQVQAEINAKRQEITDISRKHLNYFYYF